MIPVVIEEARLAEPSTIELDREAVAQNPVQQYLKEIGRVALLTAAEEVDLAKRIEAGLFAVYKLGDATVREALKKKELADLDIIVREGAVAKEKMISANLRLVVKLSKGYQNKGLDLLDVIQEGNEGLIRAVEKFDYSKGFKFSTYSTWWIRQAITRGLADQARTIRVPVHKHEQINKIRRVTRELDVALGRAPTEAEIAAEVDLTTAQVSEIKAYGRDTTSLQGTVGDDKEAELGDFIEDTNALQPERQMLVIDRAERLLAAIDGLPEREALVLKARFGLDGRDPKNLNEIGQSIGLTRERIRQIESKALSMLRHPSRSGPLSNLIDSD